jgi:hypothetical protein
MKAMAFELFNEEPIDPLVEKSVYEAIRLIGTDISPIVTERFLDSKLFKALLDTIQQNPELLVAFIKNTNQFEELIDVNASVTDENKVTGAIVDIPETVFENGGQRPAESGPIIDLQKLIDKGVDPSKVLFFRVTQPSEVPKPEYYWTTDLFETRKGLNQEITADKRKTSITLIADLATIAGNDGVIQDGNDDSGVAVRQVGEGAFDQKAALAILSNKRY